MLRPVVITRPLAQAQPLAERVTAMGRNAIVFPLLEISPLADSGPLRAALSNVSSYAMVAFVSPNAIDAAFALQPVWPQDVMLAVMGEGSRAALEHYGLTAANANIVSPHDAERTDSQTLLEALDLDALRGKRVLIVRGETGRELLGDALRAAGVEVDQVAAYKRSVPSMDQARTAQLRQLIDGNNYWIITSSEALRNLSAMAEQVDGRASVAKMQQQRIIVPHARIAETAQSLGFQAVTLTGSGDERLLAALQF